MAEKHSNPRDNESNKNSSMSLSLCDIPSFVEVDDSNPKDKHDVSNRNDSNVTMSKNYVKEGDVSACASVTSMNQYILPSFVEIRNDYYRHQENVDSPKAPFESHLSLQESMIDSSNIESVTLHSDGQVDTLDSPDQGGVQSTIETQNNSTLTNSPSPPDTHMLVSTPSRDGQTSVVDSLGQEEVKASINKENDMKNNSLKTGTPVNTSEVTLGHSCFVNVGRHLYENGSIDVNTGPASAQKFIQNKDSNLANSSNGDASVAKDLFPNDVSTNRIESSLLSTIYNTISWFGIITLILAVYWFEREDDFVIDTSVEEEPLTLNIDIASKLTYYMSRHGTSNINVSGYASQREGGLFDVQTENNSNLQLEGRSIWFRFLPTILPGLSYGILFLCACLLLQITSRRSEMQITSKRNEMCSSSKERKPLSTPIPTPKRCTRELQSLEKVNVFSSTYKHEILTNDGSVTEVRRSSRIVLLSPNVKISQNEKLGARSDVAVNLMDEFCG